MTLNGAIKQLHELRSAEDMPIYYKPIIAEVINVLLMDTQEVKHGLWIDCGTAIEGDTEVKCSECGEVLYWLANYCPNCGARMDAQIGEDKSHPFAESVMMGMDEVEK